MCCHSRRRKSGEHFSSFDNFQCVMRVGTLVIILRNINDLANGVRAQAGSITQQVGQYRAGGIGCTRAIGLTDTTQPCQWWLMEGIILLLKSTFALVYETSKVNNVIISLFIINFSFLLVLVLFFIILRSVQSLICNFWLKT